MDTQDSQTARFLFDRLLRGPLLADRTVVRVQVNICLECIFIFGMDRFSLLTMLSWFFPAPIIWFACWMAVLILKGL
jgi:hypothetical protein